MVILGYIYGTSGYTRLDVVILGYIYGTLGYTRLDVVTLGYICYTAVTLTNYLFRVQQRHLIIFSNVLHSS